VKQRPKKLDFRGKFSKAEVHRLITEYWLAKGFPLTTILSRISDDFVEWDDSCNINININIHT